MKITTIQTNQGSQNTARLFDQSGPAVDKRNKSQIDSVASVVKTETIKSPKVQGRMMTASINNIKEQLDQVLVNYPPFFPLGKYQRLDLIEKIKGIQEELEGLSVTENVKNRFAGKKLSDEATDNEISLALDHLFNLRNKLTKNGSVSQGRDKLITNGSVSQGRNKLMKNGSVSSDTAGIGSILNIKV